MHMLRNDDPGFESFGEIYFSVVFPGVIKGWHLHRRMTLNYAVPVGLIKLVLYDDRESSSTRGELMEVFSGEDNFFRVNAPAAKPELLVQALGERYEIVNTDIKKWTVGTPIQGPLDALETLMRQHRFEAYDVAEVVVRLAPAVGSVVDNRDIPDICLQHMLAVMLLYRTVSFAMAHDEARMKDEVVLRERRKVRYVADPELTASLPVRVAIVEVTLRNGMRHSERVDAVRGTPRNPMGRDEVVAKARDLIGPVLHDARSDTLIDKLLALETLGDVRDLRPLLQN